MGVLRSANIGLCVNDPRMCHRFSPADLQHLGMILPTGVSLSSALNRALGTARRPSTQVLAHLDTGASVTSIDVRLAHQMGFKPVGATILRTAGGRVKFPNFVIDLYFPGSTLTPRIDLPVCSCDMGFDLNKPVSDPRNFGVLIGRDVMSLWNIIWNGPTSTVIIND